MYVCVLHNFLEIIHKAYYSILIHFQNVSYLQENVSIQKTYTEIIKDPEIVNKAF